MTRYFVNYIDFEEVQALRATEHERPIGKYENGEEIMSHLGTVVQQYVGLASVPPRDVLDDPPVIMGITEIEAPNNGREWYMARPFPATWIKPRSELCVQIPGCTRAFVAGRDEPLQWWSFYAEAPCYAVADLKLSDGRKISELPDGELHTLFAEVKLEDFKFDPQNAIDPRHQSGEDEEPVPLEDLCFCINCEHMIHVDFSSSGWCPACGCSEPEHPGYEDIMSDERGFDCFYDDF